MLVNDQPETSQVNSQILHPGSRDLFRFWDAMRAETAAPRRRGLDLNQIRDIVPNLVILERDSARDGYRYRLAGTGICNLYRRELTGRGAMEGWDAFERDTIRRFFDGVVDTLQPCVLRFRLHTDHSQLIGAELIGLPLQAIAGGIHILGGIFVFQDTENLAYSAITGLEISAARSIWTEHLPGDRLVSQLSEPATGRPFRSFKVIPGGRT